MVAKRKRSVVLGSVADEEMRMNDSGRMAEAIWNELPHHYTGVFIDVHVVMPDHFHGIIILDVGAGPRACPEYIHPVNVGAAPRGRPDNGHPQDQGHPQGGAPTLSLFDVVHRFKSLTTARYRHGVKESNWPPFPGRLWQRNYYERIIRNDAELNAARKYILDNPMKWAEDKENPAYIP